MVHDGDAEPALRLARVHKRFGDFVAVDGIDLSVMPGEFLTLLGPSGCGKTTTLNMIAGFLEATSGSIYLGGEPVQDLPPFKRDTGMVFQDYALFPHMTVNQNIAFGLRMRKTPKDDIQRRVARALELVHLSGLGERRPAELSGGQKQRVALARALVIEPKVLLLDEPLSNLDLKLREAMRIEITNIQRELGITAIYVTHDQGEALVMSDRIAVMNKGHVEQLAPPEEIYQAPRTRFVAEFIGTMNFIDVEVRGERDGFIELQTKDTQSFALPLPPELQGHAGYVVAIRPERCRLSHSAGSGNNTIDFKGQVRQVIYLGSKKEYHIDLGAVGTVIVEVQHTGQSSEFHAGEEILVSTDKQDCRLIPDEHATNVT